jgi:hypothetical protein
MKKAYTTERRVLEAFHTTRARGEWAACEAALNEFRRLHPEASAEFAETYISQTLSSIVPGTPEWA